jgi:hypothetical protein
MRLVGMWHAKMRQREPVVQSVMWRCCCVQVLVYETLQLKRVTIEGSSELYHKGRRRGRRQGGKAAIWVSRWGDQARRVMGRWPVKFVTTWRLNMRPVLHVVHEDATVWAGSPNHALRWVDKPQICKESRLKEAQGFDKSKLKRDC